MNRQEYDAIDAVRYSLLSKMHDDPKNLLLPRGKPGLGMLKGSTIDTLLFDPMAFNDKIFVSEAKIPSEKMGALLDRYLELAGDSIIPINEDLVMAARADVEFAMTWGRSTVITKFTEACKDYMQEILDANGRIVIDKSTLESCTRIANEVSTNQYIHKFISEGDLVINHPVVVWEQILEENGTKITTLCKGEVDNITVRLTGENSATVYINDGKYTSSNWKTFNEDFIKWNYHLQPPMYTLAVGAIQNGRTIYCDDRLKQMLQGRNVKVIFNFIVYTENNFPLIYQVSSNTLQFGFTGGRLSNGIVKKGIQQLISEYLWHKAVEYYDYPKDIVDNKGIVLLDVPYTELTTIV